MISGCVSWGLFPDEVGELGGDLVWWAQEEEEEEDGPCVSYTSPAPVLPVLYAGACVGEVTMLQLCGVLYEKLISGLSALEVVGHEFTKFTIT